MKYEAEVEVLRRKIGDLESIRAQLGLSQRKICQLLFVDPSAWTRWTRDGDKAPPHIFRALQWYLALNDKYPALDVSFWLSAAPRSQEFHLQDSAWRSTGVELESLKRELGDLREQLGTRQTTAGIMSTRLGAMFALGISVGFGVAFFAARY